METLYNHAYISISHGHLKMILRLVPSMTCCKIICLPCCLLGIGRLASDKENNVYLTSSNEKCIYICDPDMNKLATISTPDDGVKNTLKLACPHYVTVNQQGNVIVTDMDTNSMLNFCDKTLKFTYNGSLGSDVSVERTRENDENENSQDNPQDNPNFLRCPSAVCCDSFDNILIADFMNDRIHLVSSSGEFLGYLLLREDGVSCPNFLTIDHEGQLIVGQYGGDINVYNYLNYTKHV